MKLITFRGDENFVDTMIRSGLHLPSVLLLLLLLMLVMLLPTLLSVPCLAGVLAPPPMESLEMMVAASVSFLIRFADRSGLDGAGGGVSVTPGRQMGAGDDAPCELLHAGDDGGDEAGGATGDGRVLNRALHGSKP